MSRRARNWLVIGGGIVAYFAVLPDDLGFVDRVLRLTQGVAPGAYAVLVAAVLTTGAVRIWGRRTAAAEAPTGGNVP
jgi:hypothetical protein